MIYLDTSVLVAYYYPEPLSDVAQKFIRTRTPPVISSLSGVELMSALSRKIREGGLSAADGKRIVVLFGQHIEKGLYQRISVSERHYQIAYDWLQAFDTALRSLDALHLAVTAMADLQLVTADKALASAATHLGITTQFLAAELKRNPTREA